MIGLNGKINCKSKRKFFFGYDQKNSLAYLFTGIYYSFFTTVGIVPVS